MEQVIFSVRGRGHPNSTEPLRRWQKSFPRNVTVKCWTPSEGARPAPGVGAGGCPGGAGSDRSSAGAAVSAGRETRRRPGEGGAGELGRSWCLGGPSAGTGELRRWRGWSAGEAAAEVPGRPAEGSGLRGGVGVRGGRGGITTGPPRRVGGGGGRSSASPGPSGGVAPRSGGASHGEGSPHARAAPPAARRRPGERGAGEPRRTNSRRCSPPLLITV